MAFLGIHGYAGIVAHMLVAAGGDVEQGSLAAVGVAHQGHADVVMALLGHVGQGAVQAFIVVQVAGKGLEVLVAAEGFAGLFLRHHLNLPGLFAAERYFIADNFVFDGVLERGVEDHAHGLPLDEAHLNQALTETPVTVHPHNHGLLAGLKLR